MTQPFIKPAWKGNGLFKSLWKNRNLIHDLAKREIVGRYKGSFLGLCWSLLIPIIMLLVYTFVFGVIFKARWTNGTESQVAFALNLFAGLIVFNFFAECVNRAPSLIVNNVNYVKKVVFPLEILSVVSLCAAFFHFLVSFLVLLLAGVTLGGTSLSSLYLLPLIIFPLAPLTLGVSWFLAALGVYVRDVAQITSVVLSVLMFMSPVFYPLSALPEGIRTVVEWIPLNIIIDQFRQTVLDPQRIDLGQYGFTAMASLGLAWLGFTWFQKTRKGFADVL
jgi:lipopolysaccharide transport system permease protein